MICTCTQHTLLLSPLVFGSLDTGSYNRSHTLMVFLAVCLAVVVLILEEEVLVSAVSSKGNAGDA
jgi:hypothetical protein